MHHRIGRVGATAIGPATAGAALLAIWLFATEIGGASPYVLPSPIDVVLRLYESLIGGSMYQHIAATVQAAVIGYCLGALTAFLLGVLVAESAIPIFTSTITGLRSANVDLVDMYRAFSASRWQIFWNVKLPSAAGQIFAGLQVSVLFALTGAVVMEFITGVQGMGFLIENSASTLDVPLIFACLVVLALLGIGAASVIRVAHRHIVFWEAPLTDEIARAEERHQ